MKTQDSGRLPHGLPRGTTDTRRPSRTPGPPFLVKESVEGAGARWATQPRGPGQVRETAQEAPGAPPVALAGWAGGALNGARGDLGHGARPPPASAASAGRAGGRGGRGARAEGKGADRGRRFPPSKVSRSCVHSALPVGVGAAPSRAGRPAAGSQRKEAGRRESGRGGGGTPRAERGREGAPLGPKVRGSQVRPGRRERALPWARRGAGARGAGLGRPASPSARTRGAGGCSRGARASPVRARAARYLPREQVSSESSAGSARRRPRRAGGRIPAAGLRALSGRGDARRAENGAAPLPPPPLPPRLTLLRRLPSSLPQLRAGSGRALWRPVSGAPAWLAAGLRVEVAAPLREQRRPSRHLTFAPCGLHPSFSFLSLT